MTELLSGLIQLVVNTPVYVWVILFILIIRGIAMTKNNKVSLGKMCLMPAIFIIWGLSGIITKFSFRFPLLVTYVVFLMLGSLVSWYLYRNNVLYKEKGQLMQEGSWLPFVIVMANFIIKYTLNVLLAVVPKLYQNFTFNLVYGMICGFTVGLFFGKIIRIIKAQSNVQRIERCD